MANIQLKHFSLKFPVLHGASRSLKKTLLSNAKASIDGVRRKVVGGGGATVDCDGEKTGSFYVQALSDLNIAVQPGERIGLVGHNGAGKTTLLRALAGIYEGTQGSLSVEGRVHALIDPQSGMYPEMTGRENTRLFLLRMGIRGKEAATLENNVEAFSDLGLFFDLPVRLYSSGMGVRLGFALATLPRTDILLMDEWFMAGDHKFQAKAKERLFEMVDAADIVVVASHSLTILREWCKRILWMEKGKLRMDGEADSVLNAYQDTLN